MIVVPYLITFENTVHVGRRSPNYWKNFCHYVYSLAREENKKRGYVDDRFHRMRGRMLEEEYNCQYIVDDLPYHRTLVFESEQDATAFILKWSY